MRGEANGCPVQFTRKLLGGPMHECFLCVLVAVHEFCFEFFFLCAIFVHVCFAFGPPSLYSHIFSNGPSLDFPKLNVVTFSVI